MSVLYLLAFPLIILGAVYAFLFFTIGNQQEEGYNYSTLDAFLNIAPFVLIVVGVWFFIAFFFHNRIIESTTGSHTLSRKDNMRVYNLVENLCISIGMTMPKVQVIEDPALNAFASGLSEKSFTVTLTRGIIDKLNDDELEGVIAHELMHIRNRDVRLLIVTIIFVGIISFLVQILLRSMLYGGRGNNKDRRGAAIALVIAIVAYFLALIFKFGLSRKREYMADAGAADMTKKPHALASALRKISGNHEIKTVKGDDIKEMFIENRPGKSRGGIMKSLEGVFSTHPPIEKRIAVLENF